MKSKLIESVMQDMLKTQNPEKILIFAINFKKADIDLNKLMSECHKFIKKENLSYYTDLAISSNDPKTIYYYSFYAPQSQLDILGKALLSLDDKEWLHKFQHHVLGLNAEGFGQKICDKVTFPELF